VKNARIVLNFIIVYDDFLFRQLLSKKSIPSSCRRKIHVDKSCRRNTFVEEDCRRLLWSQVLTNQTLSRHHLTNHHMPFNTYDPKFPSQFCIEDFITLVNLSNKKVSRYERRPIPRSEAYPEPYNSARQKYNQNLRRERWSNNSCNAKFANQFTVSSTVAAIITCRHKLWYEF
jgi:hypothetical protein